MRTLTVTYDFDEDGAWNASIPEYPGCHTFGRSIAQARTRIREALWALTDDKKLAYSVKLVDDVRLPAGLGDAVAEARAAREALQSAQEKAARTTTKALRALVKRMRLSNRDAGELLGMSYQRAQQLRHA